jgi:hypothetical protein
MYIDNSDTFYATTFMPYEQLASWSRPQFYTEPCMYSTMVNTPPDHQQQWLFAPHLPQTIEMYQPSGLQVTGYGHGYAVQPYVDNAALYSHFMVNMQPVAPPSRQMTRTNQHFVFQQGSHEYGHAMHAYVNTDAQYHAAASMQHQHQQHLSQASQVQIPQEINVHQQWGWEMMEQVGSSRIEHEMPCGFASRAPVLANTTSTLAERIPTRDPSRPPVQATKVATPRNAISRNQSLPEHAAYHAESAAQTPQGSHPVQDQQMVPAADDDAFDGLHMTVDSAEGQDSGEHDGADGLQMLARCAETSQASRQTAPPAQITQHVQMQTFRSAAKVCAKRRSTPEYQKEAREDAEARKRRFEAAAAVMATTPCRSVRKSASTRLSSGSSTQPQRCLACDTADTAKWRCGGLLCNSCVLGAKRLPGK